MMDPHRGHPENLGENNRKIPKEREKNQSQ
jgi:hypothetical protein